MQGRGVQPSGLWLALVQFLLAWLTWYVAPGHLEVGWPWPILSKLFYNLVFIPQITLQVKVVLSSLPLPTHGEQGCRDTEAQTLQGIYMPNSHWLLFPQLSPRKTEAKRPMITAGEQLNQWELSTHILSLLCGTQTLDRDEVSLHSFFMTETSSQHKKNTRLNPTVSVTCSRISLLMYRWYQNHCSSTWYCLMLLLIYMNPVIC